MKHLFNLLVIVLLLWTFTGNAQILVNEFDTAAADSFFFLIGTGLDTGIPYMNLSDDPVNPYSGSASLKCDWQVYTTESWGGFLQLMHIIPDTADYLDFSTHKYLRIMFNNQVPCSDPNTVHMRFKLHEASDGSVASGNWEDWYFETSAVYDSPSGWTELLIPLKEIDNAVGSPPNDQGFSLPGWSGQPGNQKLDLDKIVGYSIEWTSPLLPDSIASGVVNWDHLELYEDRWFVLQHFDSAAQDTSLGFSSTGTGSVVLTDEHSNYVEGTGALKMDWTVDATETWGGYSLVVFESDTFFDDLSQNRYLLLNYNNKVKSSIPGNVVLRVELYDYSDGVQEVWYYQNNTVLDADSGWNRLLIPLVDNGYGTPPNETGFSNPGWAGSPGNQQLDLDKIKAFVIEFSAGTQGTVTNGTILLDYLTAYGKGAVDTTPPDPPTALQVVPGNYYNLVVWQDPPNEPKSKYTVYYSENPITDVNAPGVEVAWPKLDYGTQAWNHLLFSPVADSVLSYYYAVTATDSAGNVSAPAVTSSPTTNTAKGVVTISLNPPTNLVCDGNLSEWSGVTPIRLFPSEGAHIVTNTTITDDNDLSVLAYLAADNDYLYVAFDVTDDVVDNSAINSWEQDSPDLFLGLYNWHGMPHVGYEGGSEPDYHFRFNYNQLIIDNLGGAVLLSDSSQWYHWAQKFPTGYVIEAKIAWADIAAVSGDDVFVPVEGYRVPIDFSINDADGGGVRQGILTLSPYNDDTSWQSPMYWVYTWIGNRMYPLGIGDTQTPVPYTFSLKQNYPNPFNPMTTIKYSLANSVPVKLEVYNTLGQKVKTLVNRVQPAGEYTVQFDANDLSSGIYFYRLKAGDFNSVRKMILMR